MTQYWSSRCKWQPIETNNGTDCKISHLHASCVRNVHCISASLGLRTMRLSRLEQAFRRKPYQNSDPLRKTAGRWRESEACIFKRLPQKLRAVDTCNFICCLHCFKKDSCLSLLRRARMYLYVWLKCPAVCFHRHASVAVSLLPSKQKAVESLKTLRLLKLPAVLHCSQESFQVGLA